MPALGMPSTSTSACPPPSWKRTIRLSVAALK
jgi:hypothetical protein